MLEDIIDLMKTSLHCPAPVDFGPLQCLARFNGPHGQIRIIEDGSTGTLSYFEGGILQAVATAGGDSRLAYVHLLAEILRDTHDVLLLGCGSGSLATMLSQRGKSVTVVDDNPASFFVSRYFFGMPQNIVCECEDFRTYAKWETRRFDGIGIDIGAARMNFDETFDAATCREIRNLLAPAGTVAMNLLARDLADPVADRIAARLGRRRGCWIYNEPGPYERNVVISANAQHPDPHVYLTPDAEVAERVTWTARRPRRSPAGAPEKSNRHAVDIGTVLRAPSGQLATAGPAPDTARRISVS